MPSSCEYTQIYVQLKIFFSLIGKVEDQGVDMLDIKENQAQKVKYKLCNYHLLSTNISFKIYIKVCIRCNCVVSTVSADEKKKSTILNLRKMLKSCTISLCGAQMFAVPFLFCSSSGRRSLSTNTQAVLHTWCQYASPDTWEQWIPVRVYAI